jgi:hypothetical protein
MRAREEIHVSAVLIPYEKPPVTFEQAAVWILQPEFKHDI